MVKIITISKEGKLVLPKEVRKEIGLKGEESYVLVADEGNIILKRIRKTRDRQRLLELLEEFSGAFKKAGITKKIIAKEIAAARKPK